MTACDTQTRRSAILQKLILPSLVLFVAQFSHAATLTGRVIRVADGDTITILDNNKVQYRIRLAGIDAPERKQPYGNKSRQNLSDHVAGRYVVVEYNKRDRYDRILG
jgi:endonuclease YncB( thermonuclease family)